MARIYLDNASLTPIDPRVLREMAAFSAPKYANPSSIYKEGVAAKKAMEDARKRVADFIHAHADEIVFTSGGTEANGLALEGAGRAAHRSGIEKPHIIATNIEHSSIMETANMMEKHGVEVTRLMVDKNGVVSVEELRKAIKPNTFMVSVMTVNNEIGSVQPIREIAKAVRWARANITPRTYGTKYPLLHTDAAQAALFNELYVEQLGIDLLTLDSGKVYGPRGMGALFVRRGTPIEPIIYGGGQERGLRSGTENVPAIIGFAKALDLVAMERNKEVKRLGELKKFFIEGVEALDKGVSISPGTSPHILNISIPGIDNEFFVLQLDAAGVAASTKSSCLQDEDESYVLKVIGRDSKTSVRFSLGRWTKKADIAKTLKIMAKILG